MSEDIRFFGGLALYLYVILGTLFGTIALLVFFGGWGFLAFLAWPLIACFLFWFLDAWF